MRARAEMHAIRTRSVGWWVVLGLLMLLYGCGRPGDSGSPDSSSQKPSSPTGEASGLIRLTLPVDAIATHRTLSEEIASAAVTTPAAQIDTEVFEIIVLADNPAGDGGSPMTLAEGDTPIVATSIEVPVSDVSGMLVDTTSNPVDIVVAPGSYRLLVLAGTASGTTSCLLASGYTPFPVSVMADQQSEVSVEMLTVSHAVSIPESIRGGESFTIAASGHTNCPVLTTESLGTTATYQFQAKFDSQSSLQVLDTIFDGSAWTATYTSDAPASENDPMWYTSWLLSGPYLTYKDPATGSWAALDGAFSRKWRWLSYTVLDDDAQLRAEVAVPVTIEPFTTGLAVNISWQ
jgi:hypothetical protein